MNNELISIIVPVYREEEYLEKGIKSLLSQTYKNLEIILVEDGSPDNCGKICDYYAQIDTRIKVIHRQNAGLVSARKQGLELASGDVIAYMDGDDWVEPEMYETLYSQMCESGADIVAAGYKEDILGGEHICLNAIAPGFYSKDQMETIIYSQMLCTESFSQFGIFTFLWNKLFRKDVLYNNQMAVDNKIFIGEDASCFYPSVLCSNGIVISDSTHYHYVQRPNSMIKTKSVHNENEVVAINLMYGHLKKIFSNCQYKDCLLPQLDKYMLSLATVRSECLLPDNISANTLFPFKCDHSINNIAIIGSGTFGQHLYKRFIRSDKFKLVFWGDEDHTLYNKFGLPVYAPEDILKYKYDIVIVAYIEETSAKKIFDKLIELGIDPEKIVRVDYNNTQIDYLLKKFGITV